MSIAPEINVAAPEGCAPLTGSGVQRAASAARAWCDANPGWEPICDMETSDHLYVQWDDLTKSQKLSLIGHYGSLDGAKTIYAEMTHRCKVAFGWIDENGTFSEDIPFGVVGMMVFHTQNQRSV